VVTVFFAYLGMLVSVGLRQIPHFRRRPSDIRHLPLFVLQLTFFMVPTRIAAFATMFHNSWRTRDAPVAQRSSVEEPAPYFAQAPDDRPSVDRSPLGDPLADFVAAQSSATPTVPTVAPPFVATTSDPADAREKAPSRQATARELAS
jgi:hypothetical protein